MVHLSHNPRQLWAGEILVVSQLFTLVDVAGTEETSILANGLFGDVDDARAGSIYNA